jgi:hypothetical protein
MGGQLGQLGVWCIDDVSVTGEPLVDGGIISYMVLGKDVANVQVEWAGEHTTVQGGCTTRRGLFW